MKAIKLFITFALILMVIPMVSAEWCYQETANVSTTCGGLNTGNYSWNGTWSGTPANFFDGNWETSCQASSSVNYIFINYSKPIGSTNTSLWRIKGENLPEQNKSITNCWNANPQKLLLLAQSAQGVANRWYCYNETSWILLATGDGFTALFEDGIFWDLNYTGNVNYTTSVSEYSNQTFNLTLNMTGNLIKNISAILNYNGTNYTVTGTNDSSTWNFTKSLDIPAISSDYNQSNTLKWYYNITYINDEIVNEVTSDYNQIVYRLRIINTTLAGSADTIRIYTYQELSPSSTVSSLFFSDWTIWSHLTEKTNNRTYNYTETSATASRIFDLYPPWATGKVFSIFDITATNYTNRQFHLCNQNVTNTTQNFYLYLLSNTSDYQKFYFSVLDVSQTPIDNAIIKFEKKVGGNYYTLGSKMTDSNGNTMERLIPDADYRITVYDGDTCGVLKTYEMLLVCKSLPCEYTLSISNVTNPYETIEELDDFIYSLEWNTDTKIVTGGYDATELNTTFESFTMKTFLKQPTGNTLICTNLSSSLSDSLTCNISNYTSGNFISYIYIEVSGQETFIRYLSHDITGSFTEQIGTDGLIWGLLIILALFLVGIYNPAVAIGLGIVGIIITSIIGFIAVSWLFFVCIAIIGIILIIKLKT